MSSVLGSTADWLRRATARSTVRERPSRRDLFTTAFWLGCVGFGGGISVLSQIDGEVVKKRGWLTAREFSNTVTVSQMLPGGAAANALAYIGMRFGGWAGALAGYVGFVLPGAVAVGVLSWVYVRFGTVPSADRLLAGLQRRGGRHHLRHHPEDGPHRGEPALADGRRRRGAAALRAGERLTGRGGAPGDLRRARGGSRRAHGAGAGPGARRPPCAGRPARGRNAARGAPPARATPAATTAARERARPRSTRRC